MKICFCSSFLEDEYEVITNSKIKPSVATHKFNLNILEGIETNIDKDLSILNTENVASYPNYNRIILKTKKSHKPEIGEYSNIGKVNLPIFKDITETIILYRELKKWIKSQKNEDVFICGYGRRLSHVIAINILKRRYSHIKTCMFLADLSGNVATKTHNNSHLKQKIVDKLLDYRVNQSKKFDSFVLLTEAMADYLGVTSKPYTVVEGVCSQEYTTYNTIIKESCKDKIIAYSGVLSKLYNVDTLLNAFQMIKDEGYKLWLFGDGELKEYIQHLSDENENIVFGGYIPNEKLREKLSECTVLINPRQNLEEFTKYSFPSKIIEYLTLGKPVISYKLDGIPYEYDDYLLYVNDNTEETLKNRIIEICEYSQEKLIEIGNQNASFVSKTKNSITQTEKVLAMFKDMRG